MFVAFLLLIVGMVLLIKGADFFVDGASKIAKAMRIPSLIIGLTLVSMGTSAPELSVSINAGLAGSNELCLGNVAGSNLFNTFLILGMASLFVPLSFGDMKKFDIPIMLGLYILLLVFGFVITPYRLDLVESITFILLFIGYIALLFVRAKQSNQPIEEVEEDPITKKQLIISIVLAILGLAAIIYGGDLVVDNASIIAKGLGMSEALVGLTIVAVGTSLPELVTSIVASLKKENDIAMGNVIGSNIFNVIFILGVSSTISSLPISQVSALGINKALFDLLAVLLSGLLVFIISRFSNNLKKWQGVLFILLYVAYLTFIIVRDFA